MNYIKVALVDDHKMLNSGLERIINSFDGMKVINISYTGKQFLSYLSSTKIYPDIVLLDIDMPEMNGEETLAYLTNDYPTIKVIMVSFHDEKVLILRMIEYGAVGYLTKNESYLELERTIREVHINGQYFSDEIRQYQIDKSIITMNDSSQKVVKQTIPPTPCEMKVLELICHQKTATQIANELALSVRTVENHRASLMKKAKVSNSIGLVYYAIAHKLLKLKSILE